MNSAPTYHPPLNIPNPCSSPLLLVHPNSIILFVPLFDTRESIPPVKTDCSAIVPRPNLSNPLTLFRK